MTISLSRPSEAVDSSSPVHAFRQTRSATFISDADGNPTGGSSSGQGFSITWQNGVQNPNGAIIEDVLAACIDRLEFFQGTLPEQVDDPSKGKFSCLENALTITHIQEALHWLNHRTVQRARRGVEGSYKT